MSKKMFACKYLDFFFLNRYRSAEKTDFLPRIIKFFNVIDFALSFLIGSRCVN